MAKPFYEVATGLLVRLYSLAYVSVGRASRLGVDLTILSVLLALIYVVVATAYDQGTFNEAICKGECAPEYQTSPLQPEVASLLAAVSVPGESAIDRSTLQEAVTASLDSDELGPNTELAVIDTRTGQVLIDTGDSGQIPASTTKVLTAFAALTVADPWAQFTTRVTWDGTQLTLVGGGDPFLTAELPTEPSRLQVASLAELADTVQTELGDVTVELAYDDSLFTGPSVAPEWEDSYISGGVVTPISALWVDLGISSTGRSSQPAAAAAQRFAELLDERGIEVIGDPQRHTSAPVAQPIAEVTSAPLFAMVESFLKTSSNEVTEVVLRHAAIAAGQPASFEGGVAAINQALLGHGIVRDGLELYDGSGLSRSNRIAPLTLAQTIAVAAELPDAASVITGLPFGGFDGTLNSRFQGAGAGRGYVQAKTGTLTGVHALAGVATLSGGRPVAFAVLANETEDINALETQAAIDNVAAVIASCAC